MRTKTGKQKLSDAQERVLTYTRLRWGAIFLIFALSLFLKYFTKAFIPLNYIVALVIIGIVYNLIFIFFVKRYKSFSENIIFSYLRAGIDILFITLAIHFTGGVESPFVLLYLLELSNIAIFGLIEQAYVMAVLSTLLYMINGFLEAFGIIPHYKIIYAYPLLFLELNYLFSIGITLLFSALLLIYMTSFIIKQLRQKQSKIEALSNAQVEFAHEVMHEVRSPLTSIIGYTEILSHRSLGQINEQQENSLAVIRRQSQHILDMANNLLNIARIEAGRTKIEKKLMPVTDVIVHTIEEMKPQFDEKDIELIQETSSPLPLLQMDEAKIHDVLTNIIGNAIKYSKKCGRIFVTTQLLPNSVQVSVRDEGRGIDPEDLPHIFDKFYRGSSEGTHRGIGLGLTLCRIIIEAHGGRIWAYSSGKDKGSVFYFTLPLE